MNKTPKIFFILAGVGLFLISAGVSYFAFSTARRGGNQISNGPQPTGVPTASGGITIDPAVPRTEICPLNGQLFTKQEKEIWEKRRPLGVMIENSLDSRPQSGLSSADIVYEAVAEGGITRFMGMFYCAAATAGNITLAPVRSARIYFVNLVSEYDALYTHVGGAGNCDDGNVDPRAKALCVISRENIKDLDQMGRAGEFKTCHRLANRLDKEVAYEHTMACFLEELYNAGSKWGWTNVDAKGVAWNVKFVPWKFKTDGKIEGTPASSINYMFWESNRPLQGNYDVKWEYDSASNSYKRFNGGEQSIDLNNKQPLMFKNVVVEFARETSLGDLEKHMLYDVIGSGKALIFIDGIAIDGTWAKSSRTARTIYKDSKGREVRFNPGTIWVSIVPTGNDVTYQ